jgi:hypothetical protein
MFMASLWWCGSQDDIISRFVIGLFPAFDTKLSSAKFYKVMLQEAVEKKKRKLLKPNYRQEVPTR